jgi:hypothetical protein
MALPAAASCAEILTIEITNRDRNSTVSLWPIGLQRIIDAIDLKNVDK